MKKFILIIILLLASNVYAGERDVRKFVVNRANELTKMEKDFTTPGYSTVFKNPDKETKNVIRTAYRYILVRDCVDEFELDICLKVVCKYYVGKKCTAKQESPYTKNYMQSMSSEIILNANEWNILTRLKKINEEIKSQEAQND